MTVGGLAQAQISCVEHPAFVQRASQGDVMQRPSQSLEFDHSASPYNNPYAQQPLGQVQYEGLDPCRYQINMITCRMMDVVAGHPVNNDNYHAPQQGNFGAPVYPAMQYAFSAASSIRPAPATLWHDGSRVSTSSSIYACRIRCLIQVRNRPKRQQLPQQRQGAAPLWPDYIRAFHARPRYECSTSNQPAQYPPQNSGFGQNSGSGQGDYASTMQQVATAQIPLQEWKMLSANFQTQTSRSIVSAKCFRP